MKKKREQKKSKGTFGIEGICADCGKPCFAPHDTYIVRGEIWREAGMGPYDSGYLHQHCLEARIGRKLTPDDLLTWFIKSNRDGSAVIGAHPDYLSSPEYRKGLDQ